MLIISAFRIYKIKAEPIREAERENCNYAE